LHQDPSIPDHPYQQQHQKTTGARREPYPGRYS
jgi:hypothetical protein